MSAAAPTRSARLRARRDTPAVSPPDLAPRAIRFCHAFKATPPRPYIFGRPMKTPAGEAVQPIAVFTVSMSCLSVNGFGRKVKRSPSGRFLAKASSA